MSGLSGYFNQKKCHYLVRSSKVVGAGDGKHTNIRPYAHLVITCRQLFYYMMSTYVSRDMIFNDITITYCDIYHIMCKYCHKLSHNIVNYKISASLHWNVQLNYHSTR